MILVRDYDKGLIYLNPAYILYMIEVEAGTEIITNYGKHFVNASAEAIVRLIKGEK